MSRKTLVRYIEKYQGICLKKPSYLSSQNLGKNQGFFQGKNLGIEIPTSVYTNNNVNIYIYI
jgi:hypothetical protein